MYTFADQQGLATADLLYELLAGECAVVYNDWDTGPHAVEQKFDGNDCGIQQIHE